MTAYYSPCSPCCVYSSCYRLKHVFLLQWAHSPSRQRRGTGNKRMSLCLISTYLLASPLCPLSPVPSLYTVSPVWCTLANLCTVSSLICGMYQIWPMPCILCNLPRGCKHGSRGRCKRITLRSAAVFTSQSSLPPFERLWGCPAPLDTISSNG